MFTNKLPQLNPKLPPNPQLLFNQPQGNQPLNCQYHGHQPQVNQYSSNQIQEHHLSNHLNTGGVTNNPRFNLPGVRRPAWNRKYQNVYVLLMQWSHEDAESDRIRSQLRQTMTSVYSFNALDFVLNEQDVVALADQQWANLQLRLTKNDLLIVHYMSGSRFHPQNNLEFCRDR